jgi:hypothetical protein
MHLSKINGQDGQMRALVTMSIFFEPDGSGAADKIAAVQ